MKGVRLRPEPHVGKASEIGILRPQRRVEFARRGQDDAVGQGEFLVGAELRSGGATGARRGAAGARRSTVLASRASRGIARAPPGLAPSRPLGGRNDPRRTAAIR